jgi:hypothetical protein
LAYASQGENSQDRALRRANKIRAHLGWKPGILNDFGEKPKGMWWRTFDRLSDEHHAILIGELRRTAKLFKLRYEI